MTQPAPPQQPADGNPFAQQPAPVPQAPVPPAAPAQGNVALGVVAGVVVALITAGIYGYILKATEREIGYAAIGVGLAIGFVAGKVGGANPVLPIVSAALSLAAVCLGQLFGVALIMDAGEDSVTLTTVLTEYSDLVVTIWKESFDAMSFLFLAIGAFAAFSGAKKAVA
ncbi:hypothetical protein [Streptomyces sp. S.PB5]|uniref:hypothetical protein n=1 Tax=Streptomyces sp. S.PB5 TaxID=3020844 RepID=UPI0025B256EC|nr:hypothetical protein [Streptomyces sp. S.PB5]MDN3024573.1 hypothetical protein [Streptomyces sp. S.PB5]